MQNSKELYLGLDYYPEDWTEENIESDLAGMKRIGINLVRVGDFSWARCEPKKDCYDLKWLRRIVDRIGESGIAVVMGTPTACPPASREMPLEPYQVRVPGTAAAGAGEGRRV